MDDLIEPPAQMRRTTAWFRGASSVVMLLALVATGAVDRIWPARAPKLLGHEKLDFEQAQRNKRLWDGSLARWVEAEAAMGSRTRLALSPWWALVLLGVGDPATEDLVVGEDGWLFLRRRAEFTSEEVRGAPAAAANVLLALRRRFALSACELRFVPIPRKSATCPEQLPRGMDGFRGVEEEVVSRLRRGGAPVVELISAFAGLAPADRFLRLDTHWAVGAQIAAAREIALEFGDLRGDLGPVALTPRESPGPAALLRFAGLHREHPAWDLVDCAPLELLDFESKELRKRLTGAGAWKNAFGGAILAGTSFTAGLPLHALLVQALEAPIGSVSFPGAEFGEPLVEVVRRRHRSGSLPKRILLEFPVFQIFDVFQRRPRVRRALGQVLQGVGLSGSGMEPLRLVVNHRKGRAQGAKRQPRAVLPPGSILTTGDGVVQLLVEVSSETPTEWLVSTGSIDVQLKFEAGGGRAWVPVVEGVDWRGGAQVFSVGRAAHGSTIQVSPWVESAGSMELGSASGGAPGVERAFDQLSAVVRAHDVLAIEWGEAKQQRAGDIRIEVSGSTADGEAFSATWAFPQAVGTGALLSLGGLQGGRLERVTVKGHRGDVRLRLVHAL